MTHFYLKNGAMLVNRIAHFIKQALSASLLLRALMRPFLSLCNSLFRVSSSFTILCVRLHENAAFAGNQMLYNRGTTRCASSKHNLTGRPHTISFQAGPTAISAVTALTDFLNVRGRQPGPLFCSVLQKPLPRCTFDSQLRRCLNFCDLDTSLYKGHSFRIGATTFRAEQGDSDAQIRALGRWKGNAFLRYIRPNSS